MAENTIHILFDPCEPTPANGYRVLYRPRDSGAPFREWPTTFLSSPAEFTDTADPLGTQYEGFIMGDCGDGKYGVPIPWETDGSAPAPESSVPASEPDFSLVISGSGHPGGDGGIVIQNDSGGGTIIDVSPTFFLITSGEFPVGSPVEGDHGGFSGVICVEASGVGTLHLIINGGEVDTIPVLGSDTYCFDSVTFGPTAEVLILLD